jgi:hypothetical protein
MLGTKQKEWWKGVVEGMKVRAVSSEWDLCVQSFGCIDGGYKLARLAWPKRRPQWLVQQPKEQVDAGLAKKPAQVLFGHHPYPKHLLKTQPVDLLLMEQGHMYCALSNYTPSPWKALIKSTPSAYQPKKMVESWENSAQTWIRGPVCKATVTGWQKQDYTT